MNQKSSPLPHDNLPPPPPAQQPETPGPPTNLNTPPPNVTRSPSSSEQPPMPDLHTSDGGCGRVLLWLTAGGVGCVGVIGVFIVGLLVAGVTTVGNITGSLERFLIPFSGYDTPVETRGISVPVVERISELSDLAVVRYNYANIVSTSTDMPSALQRLYGDELVMVAVGHIEAGVDLSQISPQDISVNGGVLRVSLPAPRLQDCFLDENQSYTVSRSTGIFAQPSVSVDNATRRFALRQFRQQALEEGLLEDAREETATIVSNFLELFLMDSGVERVVVDVGPVDLNAALPATCPE